ncbi:hypothetical protein SAMN04489761_1922 [Tenacibaculum sp. MAR_2009_124]|uniref:DUF6268 family outer membrane beta-barrel protein n=1 Tax=Tenacibaculum sp. MAR_2009_124 TaxID=1250059 RepID=UPI00089722AC|nr:DUF6268 family outer membrane beta-barrel protein [Tenacibaculum sp. MAR_2009_124]SEB84042.1 hypothetical protein SAMN04489761_1922 [Tenacibaculum sp. MAR_2009_124]
MIFTTANKFTLQTKKTVLVLFILLTYQKVCSQIDFKIEHFGTSNYMHEVKPSFFGTSEKNRVGNSQGKSTVYQANITLPLSLTINKNGSPKLWAINVGGAYTNLTNYNFSEQLVIPEITNVSLSLIHNRPLNERLSLIAVLGGSLNMAHSNINQINFDNTLINLAAIIVKQVNPNFKAGLGVAINNTFGFPMILPVIYIKWLTTQKKLSIDLSLLRGAELNIKYNIDKTFNIGILAENKGQGAFLKKEGKNMMFSHQYSIFGLVPEFKIGKGLSIPVVIGFSGRRNAQFRERKLSTIFDYKHSYFFDIAPYISVRLKYNFGK